MVEEYFRDFVVGSSYSHPEARRLWQTKTRLTIGRKPSYRAMLAGQIRRLELRTARGVFLGVLDVLLGDITRVKYVLRKVARGLYYHHYAEPLGPMALTIDQVRPDRPPPPAVISVMQSLPPAVSVGHIRYRFTRTPDEPGAMAGAVLFFDRVLFVFIGVPSDEDDRRDIPRGRARRGRIWLPPDT
jgi:hypothetical protein